MTANEKQRFQAMLTRIAPAKGVSAWTNRVRFHVAARRHANAYAPLLAALPGTPVGKIVDDRPEVLAFNRAPYLCAGWTVDERLARFVLHIDTLQHVPPLDFPVAQSINLMSLPEISETLHVVLDKPMWFHREGVLTLNLFDDNTRLFSLVFALEPAATGLRALIGGIQGRNLPAILDRYRLLTKDAHGVRPRDLIIELVRMIGRELHVTEINAISDRGRHMRHPYFKRDTMRELPLNYDEIWRDRGGTPIDEWFFALPLHSDRRSDADINPKKRSMYRQRYTMLDSIAARLPDAFASMAPVTRPDAL